MGCTISPLLFVLEMEVIIRSAENVANGIPVENQVLPTMRAFMDDVTILAPNEKQVR